MKVIIEFYGRLKAEFNNEFVELDLIDELSIEAIYKQLCDTYNVKPNTKVIKPILNDTFAEWGQIIKNNDVVGLFPPAAGG